MSPHKQILFIATSSNASPARGGRRRIVDVCRQTAKLGVRSQILCFLPFEQVAKGWKYLINGRKSLAKEAGVPVHYWPMLPFRRMGLIYRINRWYCSWVTWLYCSIHNIDLLYGHGMSAGFIGLLTKRTRKTVRVIADFHGAASEEYEYGKDIKPDDPIKNQITEDEKFVLESADGLIFVSSKMQEHYHQKYGLEFAHSEVIPCAINLNYPYDPVLRLKMRDDYGLAEKLVIVYAGSAVDYQLPDKMCELFNLIREEFSNAYFLVLTHQSEIFRRHLNSHQISPKHYGIFSVEHEKVFDLLRMGDIGLLLRDDSVVNQVASPTKFAEYLVCGLPVITTKNVGDYSSFVSKFNLGHVIDLSVLEIDPKLRSFFMDVCERREEYAQRCITFAEQNLAWPIYHKELFKVYENPS